MSITFNATEIIEMAVEMERNGAQFYRSAATMPAANAMRRTLMELAAWEEQHEKTFSDIQAQLAGHEPPPMDTEASLYVQALVDSHVFDANAQELLARCETVEDILRTAITLEKESIVFYVGFRDMVEEPVTREQLEDIIRQEMRHVAILTNELNMLK